jgi:serine/threonine protein phosphatase PrpC
MDKLKEIDGFKEFYNLNGYYLKVFYQNHTIGLISYNSNLLDGIKYEKKINYEEIQKNEKIKNLTVFELYKYIIKRVEDQKFLLTADQNCATLTLFKGNSINPSTDLILCLHKIYKYDNEYENVLSNIIISLREENRNIKKEISEIKNILNKLCEEKGIITNKSSNFQPTQEIRFRGKRPDIKNTSISPNKSKLSMHNDINDIKDIKINNNSINLNKTDNNFNTNIPALEETKRNSHNLQINNSLTISSLAKLEYGLYPPVELGQNSFCKISGYGANSYNGIVRNYNEDKLKVIIDYKLRKTVHNLKGNIIYPKISFFGLYDGHGGNKCSNFLQENFDSFLFDSEYFPLYTLQAINEAYTKAECEFKSIAFDSKNGKLLDKSGSCSITALIIEDWCFVTCLGDSRGLYSFDSGNQLYQITRDHKPDDPIERARIEKAGGNVYKDDRVKINGHKVHVKEETLAPGVIFPFRVSPGNLAVIHNFL